MAQDKFMIKKVAVLGAGVMGAQIAAHLANAKIPTILFDLPSVDGPKSSIALKAISSLAKLRPAPFANKSAVNYLQAANYDDDLALLGECDLVIEAVAERVDIKESLYQKVAPHFGKKTIFGTNTSGLSIESLSNHLPKELRSRFCGVHFFNPPRYMHLVELIACSETDNQVFYDLEAFLVSTLGKGVVRAKDTPNFIGNRVGIFSLLITMYNAAKFNLRFDEVDDLTGARLGRPKSATFRTMDVIGLDTLGHVVQTMRDTLPDDPWNPLFELPEWMKGLVQTGALGAKSKAGIFKKEGNQIVMFDPQTQTYIEGGQGAVPEVVSILKIQNNSEKLQALRECSHPQAQFLWASFRDLFHYIAIHAGNIAHTARDVDFAMRWGFGWKTGPFELWQSADWQKVAKWVVEDIANRKSSNSEELPCWATEMNNHGVHNHEGSLNFLTGNYDPRSSKDVYQRQIAPPRLLGESKDELGKTEFETDAVRAFSINGDVLVLSFKTKVHAINNAVLEGINQAIDVAEARYKGLVLWNEDAPFSVGADLKNMLASARSNAFATVENMIKLFQDTAMRLRYSQIPTIAAIQGYALGGGCELTLHCNRVVAALESSIGLVEINVGLLPAAGGTKEMARRASKTSKGDLRATLENYFNLATNAVVASSGQEAVELGFLHDSDPIMFNSYEILHVAINQALAMTDAGYRPEIMLKDIEVIGHQGAAYLKTQLVSMQEEGKLSEYDVYLRSQIADVMSGGDVTEGTLVDEQWILDLERQTFIHLLQNQKTQDRIEAMLITGKPLRN